jgi:hypothetical protein
LTHQEQAPDTMFPIAILHMVMTIPLHNCARHFALISSAGE